MTHQKRLLLPNWGQACMFAFPHPSEASTNLNSHHKTCHPNVRIMSGCPSFVLVDLGLIQPLTKEPPDVPYPDDYATLSELTLFQRCC